MRDVVAGPHEKNVGIQFESFRGHLNPRQLRGVFLLYPCMLRCEKLRKLSHFESGGNWCNWRSFLNTDRGRLFELLVDLTDEDGAVAEMEDLDIVGVWLFADVGMDIPRQTELLDTESLEKLPPPTYRR